jgi:hypothetical protein
MTTTFAHLLTVEIPYFIMARRMLVGRKQRADCTAKSHLGPQLNHVVMGHDVHEDASPRACRRKVIIVDTSHCPCQPATRWERAPATHAVRLDDSAAREPGTRPSARPTHPSGVTAR